MKRINVLLAAAASLVGMIGAAPAQAGPPLAWEHNTVESTARLRGLSAVDSLTAWASGSEGTVLRTTNAGGTWESVGPQGADELQFRDVEAFSATEALVLSIGSGSDSRIYRTADAGATWSEVFRNLDDKAFYDCMAFGDAEHGLAVSDSVDGRFRFIATSDGGESWSEVDPAGTPPALEGEAAFAASGTCLVARGAHYWLATGGGAQARVYHSTDFGLTWSVANTPMRSSASAGIFSLTFSSDTEGIAVGGDYLAPDRAGGLLAVTRDGGATWTAIEKGAPTGYRSGSAWTGSEYVVVGPNGSEFSADGVTWHSFDTESFDAVASAEGSTWASGEKGRIARLVTVG